MLVITIPASHVGYFGCTTLGATAFLPSVILLFGVRQPEIEGHDHHDSGPATVRPTGPSSSANTVGWDCDEAWQIVGRSAYMSRRCSDYGRCIYTAIGATRGTPASTWGLPGPLQVTWPAYVVRHGRILYSATHPTKGHELWVSNGTVASTHVVKDIRPGPQARIPGICHRTAPVSASPRMTVPAGGGG